MVFRNSFCLLLPVICFCSAFLDLRSGNKYIITWEQPTDAFARIADEKGKTLVCEWAKKGANRRTVMGVNPPRSLTGHFIEYQSGLRHKVDCKQGNAAASANPRDLSWNGLPGTRRGWAAIDPVTRKVFRVNLKKGLEIWINDPERLFQPMCITYGGFHDIWICDYGRKTILNYSSRGEFKRELAFSTFGLKKPIGIRMDSFQKLVILDRGSNELLRVGPSTGRVLRRTSALGWGMGFIEDPGDLAVGQQYYYVLDRNPVRIIKIPFSQRRPEVLTGKNVTALEYFENGCLFISTNGAKRIEIMDGKGETFFKIDRPFDRISDLEYGDGLLAVADESRSIVEFLEMAKDSIPFLASVHAVEEE